MVGCRNIFCFLHEITALPSKCNLYVKRVSNQSPYFYFENYRVRYTCHVMSTSVLLRYFRSQPNLTSTLTSTSWHELKLQLEVHAYMFTQENKDIKQCKCND